MNKWIVKEFSNQKYSTVNVLNSVAEIMFDSFYYQIEQWDK